MYFEICRCPSVPYVWSGSEVHLHCRAFIDLSMNSWLAHNLHKAWYASEQSCSKEILACTHLFVHQNNIKITRSRIKWRMTCCKYTYCSSIRYVSEPSQNIVTTCPSNIFSQSFIAWMRALDIAWLPSFVALVLNTTLVWDSLESLLKWYHLRNMKLKH
jgi:hypothetical protein